jgi:TctA family transporter
MRVEPSSTCLEIDKVNPLGKSTRRRRFLFIGFSVTAIASVLGLLRLLTIAIGKVLSGQGLETYRTVWLVEFNYVALLVLFAALVVAWMVSMVVWWREERQWRDFERKYLAGVNESDA